jgi:hypothetical protein
VTLSKYDKYDPIAGGFRAPLAADLTFNSEGGFGPKGVSLDANGRVVVGTAAQSGGVGLVVKNVPFYPRMGNIAGQVNAAVPVGGKAKDIVDIMTSGEIIVPTGLAAGTTYYVAADGSLTTTAPGAGVNGYRAGHTVEATRLIVRFERVQG